MKKVRMRSLFRFGMVLVIVPGVAAVLIWLCSTTRFVIGVIVFFLLYAWVLTRAKLAFHRNGRPYLLRRPDAGKWLEAPIAEVDKSTMGKLLASRMRREPGLHVVVRGNAQPLEPIRQDSLYDAELDG